jgi:carbonic anhydrase/acetyltransferase-like protein (isoleucine patch superfamily)
MVRTVNGKTPKIASTAFISEAAYVVGDVEIGENSSVWPGAVIRGDVATIKIGNNTQIEDNCVVHTGEPLVIGDNVHVGHGVVIHCLKIGNTVLIGNNATILNGAEIGDFCLIAANSLVMERMKIPSDSFVTGIPAEVKSKITPAQIARIEDGVKFYVRLSQKYKQEGLE